MFVGTMDPRRIRTLLRRDNSFLLSFGLFNFQTQWNSRYRDIDRLGKVQASEFIRRSNWHIAD